MLAGKGHALHRTLPQTPELADLSWTECQVCPAGRRVSAVAADLVAGKGTTRLWIKGVHANQHLINHLLVAKALQQARIVTRQVDHHIGATLERRLDPHHAQAGIAVDLARHSRPAFPDRGLELQHQLVAPAVVGVLDGRQVLGIECGGELDLVQRPQRHSQYDVVGLITHGADLDGHAVFVLDNRRHRRAGLDDFQLLDERLRQYRATAQQARSALVAVRDIAIYPTLLCEVEQ